MVGRIAPLSGTLVNLAYVCFCFAQRERERERERERARERGGESESERERETEKEKHGVRELLSLFCSLSLSALYT